jgi:hypothetical protein
VFLSLPNLLIAIGTSVITAQSTDDETDAAAAYVPPPSAVPS